MFILFIFILSGFFSRTRPFFSSFCFTAYLFKKIVLYLLVFFIEFLQFFHIFIYFFVSTDPREPNYQYEEGNSFGDIYASFASNKR